MFSRIQTPRAAAHAMNDFIRPNGIRFHGITILRRSSCGRPDRSGETYGPRRSSRTLSGPTHLHGVLVHGLRTFDTSPMSLGHPCISTIRARGMSSRETRLAAVWVAKRLLRADLCDGDHTGRLDSRAGVDSVLPISARSSLTRLSRRCIRLASLGPRGSSDLRSRSGQDPSTDREQEPDPRWCARRLNADLGSSA